MISEIANLLLDKHISTVPVIGSDGISMGVVCEGDLIGRTDANPGAARQSGRSPFAMGAGTEAAGFALSARVLVYPDGEPGDVSLFLIWADR